MLNSATFPKALALISAMALAACDAQIVDPQVSERLAVQAVNVDLVTELSEEMSLNGISFEGNFIAQVQENAIGRGEVGDLPTSIEISFERIRISIARGSTATGSYTLVNSTNGSILFGPQEFSVQSEGVGTAGGGLIGLAIGAAIAGVAQQNHNAFLREVEELGTLVGRRIKTQLFG